MTIDGTDLCFGGARELAAAIAARRVSAVDVMRTCLAQIERLARRRIWAGLSGKPANAVD